MKLYSQLQNLSADLLRQFGMPCVVKTVGNAKYNPETGEQKTESAITSTGYCLFDNLAYDFPRFNSNGAGKGDSALVQKGDVVIYITASAKPELNSLIEVNDEVWAVVTCQPIQPAGKTLLYQCQGRKR